MERVYMDKILGFLSAETSTPCVDVSRFEIDPDVAELIPLQDSKRLGVMAFESLGNEVMVAIMNPVDENLRKTVSAYLGRRTHFYLTSPEEFQNAIDELSQLLKKNAT
jgi:hypothetical protein